MHGLWRSATEKSGCANILVQMQLSWSSDPDGIKTISTDQTDAPVYNLSGQRLQVGKGSYKGIVIKNGKKILMK